MTLGSRRVHLLAAAAVLLAACEDGTSPGRDASLKLALAVPTGAPAPAPGLARSIILENGVGDVLVLERVALVLREIELERAGAEDCLGGEEEDDCEEFETGPMLVELPLDDGVEHIVEIAVPPGSYDEIEFEIHKAESGSDDAAFVAANPDFEGVSIRAEGTWNGEPFVFLQDLDEEQEIELSTPLVIEEGASPTTLTLRLDVTTWFVAEDGSFIDPATANPGGANEGIVEHNIKASIEAFEDEDEDGRDDD